MTITCAEQRRNLKNTVIKADLLLNGTTHFTVPCPCVYRKEPPETICPVCLGGGSIRYDIEDIEFE